MPIITKSKAVGLLLLACIVLAAPSATIAHDIPADVTVHLFVKPQGQTLRIVARVPLSAMRDVQYPKIGPEGYADLSQIDEPLRHATHLWISRNIEVYENDVRLADPDIVQVRAAIMSDRSFSSYEAALAHVTGPPLTGDSGFVWEQGFMDILLERPIQSDRSRFSINPLLARLGVRTITVIRFLPPDGAERALEFRGDPGLIHLDPSWRQTVMQFGKLGFLHILDGVDHLLFLFCLVIPFRRMRQLAMVVTAFTIAHSVTLIASAYNMAPDALWFPPLVETLIAMSIVYMALENIVGGKAHRRWMITFGFGLVHGFGFSFALGETLQFAGANLLTSLLSFNVGVELGQLLVLVLLVPVLDFFFRRIVQERIGVIILSALAHTGWHWMTERASSLAGFQFQWPEFNAALLANAMRWAMVVVLVAGVMWLVSVFVQSREDRESLTHID